MLLEVSIILHDCGWNNNPDQFSSVRETKFFLFFVNLNYAPPFCFQSFEAYYKTHQLANESDSNIAWIGALQLFAYASSFPFFSFLTWLN